MAELLKVLEKENRNKSEESFTKVLHMEKEYVEDLIHKTMPKLEFSCVKKVNNNFLEGMYLLTKQEYLARNGFCEEMNLLHVTSQSNVEPIVKDNLNWRKVVRQVYGPGTYFSNDARYANSLCSPLCGEKRAFLVCKVLVAVSSHFAQSNVPPSPIDTLILDSGRIVVKYADNEFLPLFVAYYDYKSQV
uniref:Poly [ADP-ribose] polymerase n=1 Tax=Graphocephala atropunctata TaxID=36148 RepID=A0A1B6MJB3_9HEMI